jgi:predicted nucleic acid-binding protein
MFLLDTNVLSELRRRDRIHRKVAQWAKSVSASDLFLSVITIMEVEVGALGIMRRDPAQGALMRSWIENHILPSFAGRILPVDTAVARRCAALHVPNPRSERDALIAATAQVHRLRIVTRNVVDFEPMCTGVVNPWV